MRITYGPWGQTLAELTGAARAAEEAGAEVVWVPELHRSATVSAAAVAGTLTRAGVGTAVALAFTRSPLVTALEALDLDELTGGRLVLGLGTGTRRLNETWHNVPWDRPLTRLRETVEVIRAVVAGGPMTYEGECQRLHAPGFHRPHEPVRTRIPIYLAAVGPRLTRLAGRIGDGWLSHELCSPAYLRERVLPNLTAGLDGRDREELDVVVSACCSIDPDPATARRRAAGTLAFYAGVATYRDFFAFHDLAAEHAAAVTAFRAGERPDVPDRMIDPLVLAGTPDQVAERLAGYAGLADTVKLTPAVHGNPPEQVRRNQARIIELIGTL
ncbi:alkanesulfonate monooxygenase SsuD/methylene tetrahydromethanopterin reductase-like flavin-dependent oxidoreductase (luciferase family) [Nonomuraea thailandensis]|uniref:Alkanesulfonate monooxygenase SsuD/methylene tetrahydromethanopterin reductase-like flavin-dependent oxidoreductase (Luciferase family) n=1 Tax=Nonomuraea thailandensis TaxID=1188745 RepID=A0A9X2K2X8_9ACTN|nr:LLM class flavin-dependent oxidoreductase [Nonomuraea thailandensis]MCP2357505.1 alkanesulfonate monooxygenase SsuD/methylene tetrahydromethanopterin reductase-like flavin-dependent oxidoreductase (luciferase family) [Nonomuraea thailandensis]